MSVNIYIIVIALLTSLQEEALAQVLPPYGGAPIPYISNEDDDLGTLLAILLLAGRNRNGACNCCSCCNCGPPQNIPIPYPIPFPTNNPIINNKSPQNNDYDDYEDTPKVKTNKGGGGNEIYINITESTDEQD